MSNSSNIKNAMYRGYTYTRKNSSGYIDITFNSGNSYVIAVFEVDDNNTIITESINSRIISIKYISSNNSSFERKVYTTDTDILVEARSVTINYFSPVNISVTSAAYTPSSCTTTTINSNTIYYSDGIQTANVSIANLELDELKSSLVDKDGSVVAKNICVGKWKISKKSVDDNILTIDFVG